MTRTAAEIGAGLAPTRPARPIAPGERIHVVGAGGAGASGAALLAAAAGADVTACDAGGPSAYTPALEAAGIAVADHHDAVHVTGPNPPHRLAVTKALTAVDPDHPELVAARRAGILLESWQQVVADAAAGRTLVAVSGTHGKSTTAGWLVHVLTAAGADPSALVGALLGPEITGGPPATARRGRGSTFVVEADEYAGNFDAYRPAVTVVTNIEWDHPDVFADRAAVVDAFAAWIGATGPVDPARAILVANVADPGAEALVRRVAPGWAGQLLVTALVDVPRQRMAGYAKGLADDYATAVGPAAVLMGRIVASAPDGTTVEISGRSILDEPVTVHIAAAGRHNVANALVVLAAARAVGVAPHAALDGLASFRGIGRRLERKGEARGVVVYDDYGHHPTAIQATLAAVRQREPGRRVWAVYEPLTFNRTAALLDGFAAALAEADAVAIADIWAGRDLDTTVASADGLARAVAARRPGLEVEAPGSVEATAAWLAGHVLPGDAVLVMGGGRSYRIGELLLELLA
jgi:UDP-N-acetylmuramate--alanine ligase